MSEFSVVRRRTVGLEGGRGSSRVRSELGGNERNERGRGTGGRFGGPSQDSIHPDPT